jgi:hypothetical protein
MSRHPPVPELKAHLFSADQSDLAAIGANGPIRSQKNQILHLRLSHQHTVEWVANALSNLAPMMPGQRCYLLGLLRCQG